MPESGDAAYWLDCLAKVFLRCFVLAMGLVVVWLVIFLMGGDWAFQIHSGMFQLDRQDFDLMNYYGMGLVKICGVEQNGGHWWALPHSRQKFSHSASFLNRFQSIIHASPATAPHRGKSAGQ